MSGRSLIFNITYAFWSKDKTTHEFHKDVIHALFLYFPESEKMIIFASMPKKR